MRKRPELLTTKDAVKRRMPFKEENECLIVKAELQDINNPLVYQLKVDGKTYYISKLHFVAEQTNDGVKLCFFDAKKLPKDSPILQQVKEEMLSYLANNTFSEMYESLNLPKQLVYRYIKKLPLKRRELVHKEVEIDPEELKEAYKQNKIEDLALQYQTTPKYIYKLLVKAFSDEKRKLKSLLFEKRLYIFRVITPENHIYEYYYQPYYDRQKKKTAIRYYGKYEEVNEEDLAKIEQERQDLVNKIEELDRIIEELKLKAKESN